MAILNRAGFSLVAFLFALPVKANDLPPALEGSISIPLDQARAFLLPPDTKIVSVANPSIADATTAPVNDNSLTIVTAKSYGTTNILVLDGQGRQLSQAVINVSRNGSNVVTVHHGASGRVTYSCSPVCAPIANLGDDTEAFSGLVTQMQQRSSLASGR